MSALCKSRRWVGWTAPTDISPHLLRGTGWQSRDVAVVVPARALACLIEPASPLHRLVHVIFYGLSFLTLCELVTSAFDAMSFNKHDANKSEFALAISLVPAAGVFDKCTDIIERCTKSQVNTCHTVPTTGLSGKLSYSLYTCRVSD